MADEKIIKLSFVDLTDLGEREWTIIERDLVRWQVAMQAESFFSESAYRASLLGRWLTCRMLSAFSVDEKEFKSLAVTALGKPYLRDSEVSFSISHSHGRVVCVASRSGRVGVDLELIRPIDYNEYRNCFASADWKCIQLSADPARCFLERWTNKESLLKADGRGMQIDMIDVVTGPGLTGWISGETMTWHFHRVCWFDYACTICVDFGDGSVVTDPVFIAT